ncbi:MAG: hypothetical protein HKN43_14570 [Rhodothermales bacterium]|nr:hypothetical protein [Rhodothermales bacterium]
MIRINLVPVLLLVFTSVDAFSQDAPISRYQGTAYVDSLDVTSPQPYKLRPFIIEGSVEVMVDGNQIDDDLFQVDTRFGLLRLNLDGLGLQSIEVRYRALPIQIREVYKNEYVIPFAGEDSTGFFVAVPGQRTNVETETSFAGAGTLTRSGSISRGVIAGNNRDVSIESGLRMQLSGEVVEGVNIRAALTDENTPILPEGTTQRIQELDKVFIEISTESAAATLGDFQLDLSGSSFGQFSRKLQGVAVRGELPRSPSGVFGGGNINAAGATTRGIFRSQQIAILEGVQGPYRLEGQFGERFIILVPGSEIVYLDGIRLERGESNDYIIDYATAEVTFTAKRLIGADRRVVVEFQYSTNQFTRTLVAAEGRSQFWRKPGSGISRGEIGVAVIREADSRQFTEEFGLTSADSLILAQAGDNLASRSGAVRVDFDPEAPFVQYVLQPVSDSDTVFVAITEQPDDSVAVFRVQFSRVGSAQGSYARVGRQVNGIQYEYVGPNLGDYDPIRLLPRPKKQQLFDIFGTIRPVKGIEIKGEFAQSQNDLNRLSDLDAGDDMGSAYSTVLKVLPISLFGQPDRYGSVSAEISRVRRSENFTSFNRTRDVEFNRTWNISGGAADPLGSVIAGSSDAITSGVIKYSKSEKTFASGTYGRLDVGSILSSTRTALSTGMSSPIADVIYRIEDIRSQNNSILQKGTWLRQFGRVDRLTKGILPSMEVEHERRRQRALAADSLLVDSFEFVELRPGIRRSTNTMTVGGTVEYRRDRYPLSGTLTDGGRSWTVESNLTYRPSPNFDTEAVFGFRDVAVNDDARVTLNKENRRSLVLRLAGNARPLKRAVRASWTYDARTERTPKLQEIYIRTGAELGQYVWVDANGDNVVQVDEFVLETTPNEGNYVRSFVPSDSLFSIVGLESRFRLDVDPSRLINSSSTGLSRVARQISTRTVLTISEKNRTDTISDIYLLRLNAFRDPVNTLSGRISFRQDLFLFRTSQSYGGDVTFQQIRSLNNLATGLETKFVNRWSSSWSLRRGRTVGLRVLGALGTDRTTNPSFASRNFDIRSVDISPEISYSPLRTVSITLSPSYGDKDDVLGDRQSTIWKIPVEVRLTRPARYQIFSLVEVANVSLIGNATGQAGFELTDGRGVGTSYLWSLNGQYSINEYLRAVLSYDGRAPSIGRTIHTMRMQLTAVF